MAKGVLIVGFAGVGKTYLGQRYPNMLDYDHLYYRYSYSKESTRNRTMEELKGLEQERSLNPLWPENYFSKLSENLEKYDVVLVPGSSEIITYLDEKNMDYFLCYPEIESKPIYLKRYQTRGNNQGWINRVNMNFEEDILLWEEKKKHKIVLKENETLEDKLKEMGIIHGEFCKL